MIDINALDFSEKKELLRFAWKFELIDDKRKSMQTVHRDFIRDIVAVIEEGMKVSTREMTNALNVLEHYLPELKTEEGQLRLGIEERFGRFLNESALFSARIKHLDKTGGGEVVPFTRVKKN